MHILGRAVFFDDLPIHLFTSPKLFPPVRVQSMKTIWVQAVSGTRLIMARSFLTRQQILGTFCQESVRKRLAPKPSLHHHSLKVIDCTTNSLGADQGCTVTVAGQQKISRPSGWNAKQSSRNAQMTKLSVYDLEVIF
jgi:hypothetical protein